MDADGRPAVALDADRRVIPVGVGVGVGVCGKRGSRSKSVEDLRGKRERLDVQADRDEGPNVDAAGLVSDAQVGASMVELEG